MAISNLVSMLAFGAEVGREVEFNGERWMLIGEIRNACHLAIKLSEPHPRHVYFIHVTEDGKPDIPDAT